MERKRLLKQLRRVQRLGRYHQEVGDRLARLMALLGVTEPELQLLIKHNDGYLLVADARREEKHVTLSDADEISLQRAREREEKRAKQRKAANDKREKELKAERDERKKLRIDKKTKELRDLLAAMSGNSMP